MSIVYITFLLIKDMAIFKMLKIFEMSKILEFLKWKPCLYPWGEGQQGWGEKGRTDKAGVIRHVPHRQGEVWGGEGNFFILQGTQNSKNQFATLKGTLLGKYKSLPSLE